MADCKYHHICNLPADHDGEYCILHSPDQDKNVDQFNVSLKEHRLKSHNFSHFIFPSTFPPSELLHSSDSKVFASVNAEFINAIFYGKVELDDKIVTGCNFFGAKFKKETSFNRTDFRGSINFTAATFTNAAYFENAQFENDVIFYNTIFADDLFFIDVTFPKKADFSSSNFGYHNPVALIQFQQVNFKGEAIFHNAKSYGRLIFTGTTFDSSTIFMDFKSKGKSEFTSCFFNGAPITFDRTTFESETTRFFACTFNQTPSFKNVYFTSGVLFEHTNFHNGVRFVDTIFEDLARFDGTLFKGYCLFEGTESQIFHESITIFKDSILDPPESLNFRNADFRQLSLKQLNLEKASLTAITWPKTGDYIQRNCVRDELENENHFQVERLYRELKRNFEEKKDWTRAGDFHYGEKEMRYKSAESFRLKFILWLHRTFGAYGERASVPFFWLALLFFVCSILYSVFGLAPSAASCLPQADIMDCFRYSLETLFFLKPADLVPIGYSTWVRTFESLLGPVFAALTAWAVRQQLRR